MRRVVFAVLVAAAGFIGVQNLADATQTRADAVPDPGVATAVQFEVDTNRYGSDDAGTALWIACQGTFGGDTVSLTESTGGRYRAVVHPALGEHARERLTGCLDDATLDRIRGHVVAVDEIAAPVP